MIIHEFDIDGLTILERENQSPIAGHPHRPLPLSITLELVQPMGGRIHIFRPFRGVQRSQQATDLGGVLGVNSTRRARGEEPLKPLMAKTPDHPDKCKVIGYDRQSRCFTRD
jgi:hypothetical protein